MSPKWRFMKSWGVLYYVIYNPEYYQRDRHQPFEIYRQIDGKYQLQTGEPYWLPEIGLGIGRSQATLGGIDREILSWFDQEGRRYLSSEELAQQAQLEAQKERQARLAAIAQLDNIGLTAEQISVALGLSINEVRQQLEES